MKAWILHALGAPEHLRLEECPAPQLGPKDVLVRNRAIGLNPADWKVMEEGYAGWVMPHVPGMDGAGEVLALGTEVHHLTIGARVAYHTDLGRPGSFAELTAVAARAAIPLPDRLSWTEAAALPCAGLTAMQALSKVPLLPGAQVLVTGAFGGVGGAIIQLARRRSWNIHAVASAPHADRVRNLGAGEVTDYRASDWRGPLLTNASEKRFDVIFDLIGPDHAAGLAPLLAANGHLVCVVGRLATPPLPAFATTISLHEVGLNALHRHGADHQWSRLVEEGVALARSTLSGEFDAQVVEVASFEDLPAALERQRMGPNPGKRVVEIP